MIQRRPWREQLKLIVDMMRDLSKVDDPQAAAVLYGERLRMLGLLPISARVSVSRRNLQKPFYRITRSSKWTEQIDPWKETDRLPMFSCGLLGELVYSDEPAVIENLPDRLKEDDPGIDYLRGYELLVSAPQFEDGESLNSNVMLVKNAADFPLEQIPNLVWMSNLWGRGVLNLVLRKELQKSHEELQVVNKALDKELRVVGRIQQTLLPLELPEVAGLELAASYQTSARAGGDYYDLFDCGDGCWGILIADVSGHGAPAAVIMAITHAIAHLHPGRGTPPGALLNFVNATLASKYTNGNGSFVTAFYGLYDSVQGKLVYARAGHNPPRLLREGKVSSLDGKGGIPLGMLGESVYEASEQKLERGDLLMLYTDGIVEARSGNRDMFGVERLDEALISGEPTAKASVRRVLGALEAFTDRTPLIDDQTLLAAAVQ